MQREALVVLIQGLGRDLKQIKNLNAATFEAIAIQAKIDERIKSGEKLDEPTNWVDRNSTFKHQTPGRPTDPREFQLWVRSGMGQLLTRGGEQSVQDALTKLNALCGWIEATLETTPKRGRGSTHEIVVRRAIRRLRPIWLRHTKRPAGRRGRFPRFVEVLLRPALHGHWPPEIKFESAIRDVVSAAKLREEAKSLPSN